MKTFQKFIKESESDAKTILLALSLPGQELCVDDRTNKVYIVDKQGTLRSIKWDVSGVDELIKGGYIKKTSYAAGKMYFGITLKGQQWSDMFM